MKCEGLTGFLKDDALLRVPTPYFGHGGFQGEPADRPYFTAHMGIGGIHGNSLV